MARKSRAAGQTVRQYLQLLQLSVRDGAAYLRLRNLLLCTALVLAMTFLVITGARVPFGPLLNLWCAIHGLPNCAA